jgi:hypothetical protein
MSCAIITFLPGVQLDFVDRLHLGLTANTNTDPGKWHIMRFSWALCLSVIVELMANTGRYAQP